MSHCAIKETTPRRPLTSLFILDLCKLPLFSLEEISGGRLNKGCGFMHRGPKISLFFFLLMIVLSSAEP